MLADLGTHAFHLVRYLTGLEGRSLQAHLTTLVPGRRVADNGLVTLRLDGGVSCRVWASMAATGQAHGRRVREYGSRASLDRQYEDPRHLVLRRTQPGWAVTPPTPNAAIPARRWPGGDRRVGPEGQAPSTCLTSSVSMLSAVTQTDSDTTSFSVGMVPLEASTRIFTVL